MKRGIAPEEVAELFYKYLMEKKFDRWLLTFRKSHQDQAVANGTIRNNGSIGYSSPNIYWRAGLKMQEKYDYTYKRVSEKDTQIDENRWKFFFQRYKPDGKKSGSPAPITIVRDKDLDGEWRVDVATV